MFTNAAKVTEYIRYLRNFVTWAEAGQEFDEEVNRKALAAYNHIVAGSANARERQQNEETETAHDKNPQNVQNSVGQILRSFNLHVESSYVRCSL